MVRAGWLSHGKMVIYPIRDNVDDDGRQLVNWVAEIETPTHLLRRDWNKGLGAKLQGKLNLYVGDMDNYYLNLGVYLMEQETKKLANPPAEIDGMQAYLAGFAAFATLGVPYAVALGLMYLAQRELPVPIRPPATSTRWRMRCPAVTPVARLT